VATFKVGYLKFDKSGAYNPVPTLFSSEPQKVLEAIKQKATLMEDYMQILATKLLIREELSIDEAMTLITSPRQGQTRQPLLELWKKTKYKRASTLPKPSKEDKGNKAVLL